jgi:hypothetical protein
MSSRRESIVWLTSALTSVGRAWGAVRMVILASMNDVRRQTTKTAQEMLVGDDVIKNDWASALGMGSRRSR